MDLDAKLELRLIQELISKTHDELLEVNKKFLEISVRVNTLRETLDKDR